MQYFKFELFFQLEKKMKLSGIDKFEWGNYDKQVGTGFFTHGYQHYMDYARTLLDVKNVNLKMQPFGWRQANIGYQIYERCTTPENKNDDSYRVNFTIVFIHGFFKTN